MCLLVLWSLKSCDVVKEYNSYRQINLKNWLRNVFRDWTCFLLFFHPSFSCCMNCSKGKVTTLVLFLNQKLWNKKRKEKQKSKTLVAFIDLSHPVSVLQRIRWHGVWRVQASLPEGCGLRRRWWVSHWSVNKKDGRPAARPTWLVSFSAPLRPKFQCSDCWREYSLADFRYSLWFEQGG